MRGDAVPLACVDSLKQSFVYETGEMVALCVQAGTHSPGTGMGLQQIPCFV